MPIKFCANLSFMFQESPSLLGRYKLAKEAGFHAVECAFPYDFPVDEVHLAKKEAGVQQILINSYPGRLNSGERGLAAISGRKNEFQESIHKSITYAERLECKRIHIMSGTAHAENHENWTTYINNLKYATQIFEEHGIVGLIEPINSYSLPGYFLNSFQKALSVIQTINNAHLRLQLDLFHLQQICGNLTKNIKDLFPYIGHIQIAQVPNRHEPNTPGEINYEYIFSLLNQLGYDGWIGLEYIPKEGTVEGLSWIRQFGYVL